MNFLPGISNPDDAQAAVQGLFPAGVETGLAFPWDEAGDLMPGEAQGLSRAVDKRLREFAAGRRAARAAMVRLGRAPEAIPHQSDRAPLWPEGLAGSISHTGTLALAVLCRSRDFTSLGLDIEENLPLPGDLWAEVCTRSELAWLSVQPEQMRGQLARLIFSAKECAYKLQYPHSRLLLGFDAFEITADLETGQFEATLTLDAGPFTQRTQFCGRFVMQSRLLMTGMALPPGT